MNEDTPETQDQPKDQPEDQPEIKATPEDVRGSSNKGRKFVSDSPTMAEIRQRKKPNVRKCVILLDSALSHEIDDVAAEIDRLTRKQQGKKGGSLADPLNKQLEELEDKLEALEEEAAELSVEFSFQDIGRLKYDELLKDNPPTDEDQEMWKAAGGEGKLVYSLESFPPALVSVTSLQPKISLEDAKAIFEEWSEGDLELIFNTAFLACKEPTSLPKSRAGTAKMRASQRNSTTALNEESPTPNS